MELKNTFHYPQDTETLLKMYINEDFSVRRWIETGSKNVEILESGQSGDVYRTVTRLENKMEANIPNFAKKFIKDTIPVLYTEEWIMGDGQVKEGCSRLVIEGLPVEMHGECTLRPTEEGGCEEENTTLIVVKIPLVGKALAKLLGQDLDEKKVKNYEIAKSFLKEND